MDNFLGTLIALLSIVIGGLVFYIKDNVAAYRETKRLLKQQQHLEERNMQIEKATKERQEQITKELNNASNEEIISNFHHAFGSDPGRASSGAKTPDDEDTDGPHN